MTWVRLDDQFDEHPKFEAAGPLAGWLFVVGLTYAARNLTDGFVPRGAVRRLADWHRVGEDVTAAQLATELVEVGLWEAVEGGYQVHDYLDYQPSRAQVLAERERNRQRQTHYRQRNAVTNAVTNGVTNTVSNGHVTPAPYPYPYPVPVPPVIPPPVKPEEVEAEGGGGTGEGAAAPSRPAAAAARLSDEAREVLDYWRACQGKRVMPKLNPTQAADLEAAVQDLGVGRLREAAEYAAKKGLTKWPQCLASARSKRVADEAHVLSPAFVARTPLPTLAQRSAQAQQARPNRAGAAAYCACGRVYAASLGTCPTCGRPAHANGGGEPSA